MRITEVRRANEKWRMRARARAVPCRAASAGIMISKGPGRGYKYGYARGNTHGGAEEEGGKKERKEGETDSPVPFVCPCTVGGMLRVGLTARIYILPARIFISVRGRVTSSMTGGRHALPPTPAFPSRRLVNQFPQSRYS